MRHALAASLVLLLAASGAAQAQDIPSPFRYIEATQSAAGYVGWLSTDTGDADTGAQSGPLVGGQYTVRLSGPLSLESTLGVSPTQRAVQRRTSATGQPLVLETVDEVDALRLLGEAGLRFHVTGPRTWNGLAPYASLTAGVHWDVLGESEVDASVDAAQRIDFGPGFAIGAGAGTDWFLTERLALRLEVRDRLWRLETPGGLTQSQEPDSQWTHNIGLTLGAAFYF